MNISRPPWRERDGFGRITDGRNTDTDWFALDGRSEIMLAQSVAETSGDITLFDIDAETMRHGVFLGLGGRF